MGFLRPDSEIMIMLGRMADYLIALLLCVLCCLPIVTAGAAVTAMYYVSMKLVRGEEPSVCQAFFKSFRENFKQATGIWVVCVMLVVFLVYDWFLTIQSSGFQPTSVFQIILMVVSALVVMMIFCVFPLLARFQMSFIGAFKTAFLFAFLHPVQMLVLVFVSVVPYVVGMYYMEWFLGIWLFCVGFTLYYASKMFVHNFKVLERQHISDDDQQHMDDDDQQSKQGAEE